MRVLILSLLLATSMSAQANQSYVTAQELLVDCEGKNKQFCYGFLSGYVHGWDGARTPDNQNCLFINAPDDVNFRQMALVFIKWGKGHPERLHEHAAVGVFSAFSSAWPCPKP